ncbi:EamA family transporter [Paenibacillus sp. MMS20-IR301]|uniref:EamA family transporter n=1 Tax=Paenibacillus sp. MMS20-IR301 TaxID=2895946 RepID=UPI0028E9AFB8|nr:EamA family transporter [Paenibacillus sp. MMS20-IR301]WNS42741.1 EamA family transporter [Paenibacillus sp. MMS20-IR301]
MTLMGAFGGYSFKKLSSYKIGVNKGFVVFLLVGGSLYFISAILNVILLGMLPYTKVYPLTSITYLWTLIISYYFLSERITLRKIFGILLIIIGAFCLIQ